MNLAYMYATPDVNHTHVTAVQGEISPTLSLIRSTGYSGVELLVRDPRLVDASALESAVRLEGLDLPAICTGEIYGEDGLSLADPDSNRREDARERMMSALELASRFDAIVNVGRLRGRYLESLDRRQTMDWMVESVTICAQTNPDAAIVMEPVNRNYANEGEHIARLDESSVLPFLAFSH